MRSFAIFAALAGASALSGCGSVVVATLDGGAEPQQANVKSHVVKGPADAGGVASVTDRTSNGVDTTVTLYVAKVPFTDNVEVPTSAAVAFSGQTDAGAPIPPTERLRAPTELADRALRGEPIDTSNIRYGDGDSFLQLVSSGNGYAAARYETKAGGTGHLGYVVAGQRSDASAIPTAGTATFNGKAHATVFGSASGRASAEGNARIVANFGNRTVNGTISNLTVGGQAQPGTQIILNQAPIAGNSYSGSVNMTGAASSSGNYQGGFYNPEVNGTAGSFHLRASGVGGQDIEAVGAFGGNR